MNEKEHVRRRFSTLLLESANVTRSILKLETIPSLEFGYPPEFQLKIYGVLVVIRPFEVMHIRDEISKIPVLIKFEYENADRSIRRAARNCATLLWCTVQRVYSQKIVQRLK